MIQVNNPFSKEKQELITIYNRKLTLILKIRLSGKNLVKAINIYAVSVLTYCFGVINWIPTDREKIQTCTRSLLTVYRFHHTYAIERVKLPRRSRGRGLIDISALQNNHNMRNYMQKNRTETSGIHMAVSETDNKLTVLNLSFDDLTENGLPVTDLKTKLTKWASCSVHGRYSQQLHKPGIEKQATHT
jgi:hypothetical protein